MALEGYEYVHEERVTYENGKPVKHVKVIKRDLSPEEAQKIIDESNKMWSEFDAAFKDFDAALRVMNPNAGSFGFPFGPMKNMFEKMKNALGALRAHLGKRNGGQDGK